MRSENKTLRICKNGHRYYKSSDCPTCPQCEEAKKKKDGFLSLLAAPAQRALINRGITTLDQLTLFREDEILQFHGMGQTALSKLNKVLKEKRLSFKP